MIILNSENVNRILCDFLANNRTGIAGEKFEWNFLRFGKLQRSLSNRRLGAGGCGGSP